MGNFLAFTGCVLFSLGSIAGIEQHIKIHHSEAQMHRRIARLTGITQPYKTVRLAAKISSTLTARHITKGSTVKKGQHLITLDSEDAAEALTAARSHKALKTIEFASAKRLQDKNYGSKASITKARAALDQAIHQEKKALIRQKHCRVHAPFDGVVSDIALHEGSRVSPGTHLITVNQMTPLKIQVEIDEKSYAHIRKGQHAIVSTHTQKLCDAEVSFIGVNANPETRTYPIELILRCPPKGFPADAIVSVHLPLDTLHAHKITPDIVHLNDDKTLGVKVVENKTVVFYPVTIVDATPTHIWVTGMPNKVHIITQGAHLVRSGQHIS